MRLMRFISFVVILIILAVQNQGAYTPSVQAASGDYIKGTFITVWGDGAQDSGESFNIYFLIHDQGKKIRLIIREDLLYSLGGSINFNQNEVIVRGKWLDEGESYLVQRIHLAEGVMRDSEGIYGPQPWASVLC